ncbi:hypothetical protein [Thalassobacillus sp. CUG 92003]|uniref:hypothetical protein n=1 Tax=Thalassobacillus sp. CUG 92003 TaxID=2736641 RepID=UPI0015E661DB|nr:hypothetical protein [Thalassobacillus sp. CUG 92003]
MSDKDETKLSALTCHLETYHFIFGPGKLVATHKGLLFVGNTKTRGETKRIFPYEHVTPIHPYKPRGLFKYVRKLFSADFKGSFMYEKERYVFNMVIATEQEFDHFINVVNNQITLKNNMSY